MPIAPNAFCNARTAVGGAAAERILTKKPIGFWGLKAPWFSAVGQPAAFRTTSIWLANSRPSPSPSTHEIGVGTLTTTPLRALISVKACASESLRGASRCWSSSSSSSALAARSCCLEDSSSRPFARSLIFAALAIASAVPFSASATRAFAEAMLAAESALKRSSASSFNAPARIEKYNAKTAATAASTVSATTDTLAQDAAVSSSCRVMPLWFVVTAVLLLLLSGAVMIVVLRLDLNRKRRVNQSSRPPTVASVLHTRRGPI